MLSLEQSAATRYRNDDLRWEAVVDRDSAADGQFYYSVDTTGVYCRPSCPSRQARREHVQFHPSIAEAKQAGFRACKRCRPDDASLQERNRAMVAAACRLIEGSESRLSLGELGRSLGVSTYHFQRTFKAVTGVTPKEYGATCRSKRADDALTTEKTVTDAMYVAGYESSSHFYQESATRLGMKPKEFKRGGAEQTIRYATRPCDLGTAFIAATENGVCAIFLGDDVATLVADLKRRFPKATISPADGALDRTVDKVMKAIETPSSDFDLPLDIQGTAFQVRVWNALRTIPAGETKTYGEIAEQIGQPKAVRAVGTACGANPISVLVPCHRVLGRNNSLCGYHWGLERKVSLLQREKKTKQ